MADQIRQRQQQQQQQQQPKPGGQYQNREQFKNAQKQQRQQNGGLFSPRNLILAATATVAVLYLTGSTTPADIFRARRAPTTRGAYYATVPSVTRADAVRACEKKGGSLAEITTATFNDATKGAFLSVGGGNRPLWIQSYNGDSYGGGIVLYLGSTAPGGSVNVWDQESPIDALCSSDTPFSGGSPVQPLPNPSGIGNTPGTGTVRDGVQPYTKICTGASNQFAILSGSDWNPPVGNASDVCASVGLRLADLKSNNWVEARELAHECIGKNSGAWIRSWNTDVYEGTNLEFRTGETRQDGTAVAPYSGTLPALCQGVIPKCSTGKTTQKLILGAKLSTTLEQTEIQASADGFTRDSVNAYLVNPSMPLLRGRESGYETGQISPSFVAYNGFGTEATFVRLGKWDLRWVYATSAWNEETVVTFTGYKGNENVGQKTVTVGKEAPTLVLLGFQNIDRVVVASERGARSSPFGSGNHVVLEDWEVCSSGIGNVPV